MFLKGESAGSTNVLYSLVKRAIGVTLSRPTGGLPVMMPPSMTAPIIISALGSPLALLTNCAKPMRPLRRLCFHTDTVSATLASIMALPKARPVLSQPPPGLAGIIILMLAAAWADKGSAACSSQSSHRFQKFVTTHGKLLKMDSVMVQALPVN